MPHRHERDPQRDRGRGISDVVDSVGEKCARARGEDDDQRQHRRDREDDEGPFDRLNAALGGGDAGIDDAVGSNHRLRFRTCGDRRRLRHSSFSLYAKISIRCSRARNREWVRVLQYADLLLRRMGKPNGRARKSENCFQLFDWSCAQGFAAEIGMVEMSNS